MIEATAAAPTRAQAILLVTSWVGLSLGVIIVMSSTFSVLFGPISSEFGWERAELALAYSLFSLTSTLAMPAIGRFVDSLGARPVIIVCATMFAITAFCLRFATQLWHFYALFIVLGLFSGGTSTLPYFKVLVAAFSGRRGTALGVANSGTAAGTFLFPLIAFQLNDALGWRDAYLVMGLGVGLVTAAVMLLGLRDRFITVASQGTMQSLEPSAQVAPEANDMSLPQAARTPVFWLVGVSFFMATTALVGYLIHVVPLLTDRGMPAASAAVAASTFGAAQVLGRVCTGFLLDRFPSGRVMAALWSLAALSFALLWSGTTGFPLYLCTALLGLAFGGEGDVLAYVVGRLYGARSFGRIYSVLLMINLLGGVVGPYLFGAAFDAAGSYTVILGSAALCMVIAAVMVLNVRTAAHPGVAR